VIPTIDQAIDIFTDQFGAASDRDTKTRATYNSAILAWRRSMSSQHIIPESFPLDRLTRSVVTDFAVWLRTATHQRPGSKKPPARYSPTSIRLFITVLRRALDLWRTHGWISFSAAEEKEYFKAHTVLDKRSTVASQRAAGIPPDFGERMLRAAFSIPLPPGSAPREHNKRLTILRTRALVAVLVSTGLRIGDVCSLTRKDLETARSHKGMLVLRTKKTHGEAHVFLADFAIQAIDAYLAVRGAFSSFLFIRHHRSGQRVSASRLGEAAARESIYEVAARAYPGSSRPAFHSPHAFRHWFAQDRILRGMSLENVQSQLGHASPATTKIIYAPQPDSEQLRAFGADRSDSLSRLVRPPKKTPDTKE
jgi:integrase